MSKDAINQYDATAANNTDVGGISIDEGMLPSNVNNALREIMSHLKDVDAGTSSLTSPVISGDLTVDTDTLFVDSTNNRVGVGTVSPVRQLHLNAGSENVYLHLTNTGTGATTTDGLSILVKNSNSEANIIQREAAALTFATSATERMRIDSSGNVLVGQTTANSNAVGIGALSYGSLYSTRDGGSSLLLNRKTSNGDIAVFQKDGSTVGLIGTSGSYIHIGSDSVQQTYIGFNNNYVYPSNNAGGFKDNAIDLGNGSARFDDVYATNGTIQTSDQNEKQDIASLTDAEIAAAKRISNGFKTFKWNDAVAAKGDNARTHTGVIAQEVRTALEAEGLDAGNYAFFMSNTWWETQTEVPAVEAVEAQDAVLDDDGNIVTEAVEAVEAQDAYTRTDTYDTAEEAPEGATERTRLGIRYPELLAFVGAATEQRLTSIEVRLTALEG